MRAWRYGMGLAIIALAGCRYGAPARVDVPADTTAGTVPFEMAGVNEAAIIVPVHVNGEGPFDFVLDTGATFTCIDDTLARRLDLPEASGQIGFGATITGAGRMRLVDVDSLRVGGITAHDLTACAIQLPDLVAAGLTPQGLLGLNFLRSFRVVLDFERNILALEEP